MTCGPTWVSIDNVRVISNISRGELGIHLMESLQKQGFCVTTLMGPLIVPHKLKKQKIISFHYFDELKQSLFRELKKPYHICIHAAAVSDFAVQRPKGEKISSRRQKIVLHLKPTEKIIRKIKRIHPKIFLVGFKLETNVAKNQLFQKAKELFEEAHCDVVVANRINGGKYTAWLLDKNLAVLGKATTRKKLALVLSTFLRKSAITTEA